MLASSGLEAVAIRDLESDARLADVIACCTPAREPFLDEGLVAPGTFVAAVGADNPDVFASSDIRGEIPGGELVYRRRSGPAAVHTSGGVETGGALRLMICGVGYVLTSPPITVVSLLIVVPWSSVA